MVGMDRLQKEIEVILHRSNGSYDIEAVKQIMDIVTSIYDALNEKLYSAENMVIDTVGENTMLRDFVRKIAKGKCLKKDSIALAQDAFDLLEDM